MIADAAQILDTAGYGAPLLDEALVEKAEAAARKEAYNREMKEINLRKIKLEEAEKKRLELEKLAAETKLQQEYRRIEESNNRKLDDHHQANMHELKAKVVAWADRNVMVLAPSAEDFNAKRDNYLVAGVPAVEGQCFQTFKALASAEAPILTVAPVYMQYFQAANLFHHGMTKLPALSEVCSSRIYQK
jgi:hypothetical protein